MHQVREVTIRYTGRPINAPSISSPETVYQYLLALVEDDAVERLIALYLDAKHKVIGSRVVSVGSAIQSLVHPREVFQSAVLLGAVAVVVAHNHPSGSLDPSTEDTASTKRLVEAGTLLGIQVLDHVIFARDCGFLSMRDKGSM